MPASMSRHDGRWYGSVAVAKEAGISLRQLYYWVNRLKAVQPQTHPCGCRTFRRFTSADLDRLTRVRRLVERGYRLTAAVRIVNGDRTSC